jgi:hypothetical protein
MNLALTSRSLHAGAVGHGIAHAIYASQAAPMTPEEWVLFCLNAADEAEASVRESPPARGMGSAEKLLRELCPEESWALDAPDHAAVKEAAQEAGAAAFRACMPKLTGRRTTQAYIACVAAAVQRSYFTGSEAKALLYTAQLALSAHPHRRANRGRKESR